MLGHLDLSFSHRDDAALLVRTTESSDGVFLYPGSGGDMAFLAAEEQLPLQFFDPDRPENGGLVPMLNDYDPEHAVHPSSASIGDPGKFHVPDVYTEISRRVGMTIRTRKVKQLSILVPDRHRGPGEYMPLRISDIDVRQKGREDRCVRVLFLPVDSESVFRLLHAARLEVAWVALLKQGGFSNRLGGRPQYESVPRLVQKYLRRRPHGYIADEQFDAPPHPDWPDICIPGWGWGEARLKAVVPPERRSGPREPLVSWVHPGLSHSAARTHKAAPTGLPHLLRSLPSLQSAEGVQPWHRMKLVRWATQPERTEQQQAAVRFLFRAGGRAAPMLGPFEPIRDLLVLDDTHRRAVEAWFLSMGLNMLAKVEGL